MQRKMLLIIKKTPSKDIKDQDQFYLKNSCIMMNYCSLNHSHPKLYSINQSKVRSLKICYFWISMERIYIYADEIYLTSQIHICTELVGTKKDRMVSVLFRSMAAVNPMNSSSIPNHSCKSMVLQGRHSRGAMVASASLLFNVIGASTSYTF